MIFKGFMLLIKYPNIQFNFKGLLFVANDISNICAYGLGYWNK
jgi:hypothetical protein